jgi:hypothetical protein
MEQECTRGAFKRKRAPSEDDLQVKKLADCGDSTDPDVSDSHDERGKKEDQGDSVHPATSSADDEVGGGEESGASEPVREVNDEENEEEPEAEWVTQTSKKKQKKKQMTSSVPVFCKFPVILYDTEETKCPLQQAKWQLGECIKSRYGAVATLQPLGMKKILVGCCSVWQQSKLAKATVIGKSSVGAYIPTAKVDGVVSGVPLHVEDEQILKLVSRVIKSGNTVSCKVTKAARLSTAKGEKTKAIRLTFEAETLPDQVVINAWKFEIRPYVAQVVRCYKCQRFGHTAKNCHAKAATCSNCGGKNHKSGDCHAPRRKCYNCGGEHSSAYKGCEALKLWRRASQLRAETYMPRAHAFRLAKQESAQGGVKTNTAVSPAAVMKTPLPKTPPQSQEQQAPKDNSEEFPPLPVPDPRPRQVLVANRDSPAKGESQKCAQSEKRVAVTGSALSVNEVARLRSENEHLRQQVKKLTDQLSVLSDKISSLTAQLAGNKSVQQCDANEAKACDVFITFLRSNPAVLQALEKTFPASSK